MKIILNLLVILGLTALHYVECGIGGIKGTAYPSYRGVVLIDNGPDWDPKYCSGSILTNTHILTGAVCCNERLNQLIIAGAPEVYSSQGREYFVTGFKIFPEKTPLHYAACVIKVRPVIQYSEIILPLKIVASYNIAMFSKDDSYVGLGYGSTSLSPRTLSEEMYGVQLPVIKMAHCLTLYDTKPLNLTNYRCVGTITSSFRMQIYDCGGPIVSRFQNVVFGISQSCIEPNDNNLLTYPTMMLAFDETLRAKLLQVLREL